MGIEFQSVWDEYFTALTVCNTVVVSGQPVITDDTLESSFDVTVSNDISVRKSSLPNGNHKRLSVNGQDNPEQNNTSKANRSQTLPPDIIIEKSFDDNNIVEGSNVKHDLADDYLNVSIPRRRMYSKALSDRLSRSVDSINSWLHYGLLPKYEYESPDEGALVKASACYGYKLADRTPEQIFFATPTGDIKIFDILQVLQFDSARKRMSVIVRDNNGRIKMYCKGADSAIMMNLKDNQGMSKSSAFPRSQ